MKKPPRRPKLAITFGVLLLSGAGVLAWFWFYTLAPMRRVLDLDWRAMHSKEAQWAEEQKSYRRFTRSPDLWYGADDIYRFGDETWFKWLLDRVLSGDSSFRVCGCTMECLAVMSNHDFDADADWANWYEANKEKTQEEWIQDGFATQGMTISLPPSDDETESLLMILGKRSKDPKNVNSAGEPRLDAPGFMRYNAYRWLRDMGFDPVAYLLKSDVASLPKELKEGVTQYREYEKGDVPNSGLGRLSFAPAPESDWRPSISVMVHKTGIQASLLVIVLVAGVTGLGLTRRGIRTLRLKSAPASAASHPPDTAGDR